MRWPTLPHLLQCCQRYPTATAGPLHPQRSHHHTIAFQQPAPVSVHCGAALTLTPLPCPPCPHAHLPARRLKAHSPKAGARAVILSPTRELALQTHKVVRELGKTTDLRTAVLVGGDAMEAQFAELANNPDVMVATPGGGRTWSLVWQWRLAPWTATSSSAGQQAHHAVPLALCPAAGWVVSSSSACHMQQEAIRCLH